MTDLELLDEPSRWRADAAVFDAWFDQPWGRYASSAEYALLLDATGPVTGLDVCDAGCGTGRFTARLEAEGARVVGVDADPASLEIARTQGTIRWSQGLYAPAASPGVSRWGPLLECVGRRVAPGHAAFEVVTITVPERRRNLTGPPPFVTATDHDEPSVFQVENLLREARRQRHLGSTPVPAVCLLDPDGDTIRHLAPLGRAARHADWACYHSELWTTDHDGIEIGIVPCAVGAPYAVLVAEELAASGCRLLVSVTSAGTITPLGTPPYFVLIERAWRDEGTSHRYLPPGQWATIPARLDRALDGAFDGLGEPVHRGTSWTTDAPFRETASAIERARVGGVNAVEMEAAALYAYAEARHRDVVCIAHVTNTMATDGDDFEKGHDNGTDRILRLVTAIAGRWSKSIDGEPAQASEER